MYVGRALVATSCCLAATACSADAPSAGARPTTPAVTTADVDPAPGTACPNPHGGACLGDLTAGRYATTVFVPGLTYAVPDGWSNQEDLPGNFLLLPPGRDVDGVDAGTADYVGVYNGVTVAQSDCEPRGEPGVGLRARDIVTALGERPGLDVTEPSPVTVGGLRGFTVDVTWAGEAGAGCDVGLDTPIVPLFIGAVPAEVEHAQLPGQVTRLHVLDAGSSNVLIEVADLDGDTAPFDHASVVDGFRLG